MNKTLSRWSRRLSIGLIGLILFVSLSALPTTARDNFQIPILDNQPPQSPQTEPSVSPSPTAPGLEDPQEFADFTNTFFNQQLSQSKIPGAIISVVKDGEIFFTGGYGYANLEEKIPVEVDKTVFRVASLSKLFTATAAMQLYEQGLLDIHSDVNQYLEGWQLENPYSEPVTPARMMMHTDGTTQRLIGIGARTEAELQPLGEYLPEYMPPIHYSPGKFYSYSNHSIALLGYLVEKISGLPFVEYIDQNIFQPLQMQRSSFLQPPPPELADDLAVGYQLQGGEIQPVPYLYLNIVPAAALSTTAVDMAHFMIAHLQLGRYEDARILQPETAELMHTTHYKIHPKLPGTSYGFRERFGNNLRAIGHLGSLRGYSSILTLIPEENIGIFIATNSFTNIHDRYLNQFFDRYFPEPPDTPSESALQQPIDRFVGTYRDMEYPRSTIAKITGVSRHIKVIAEPDGSLLVQTPRLFFPRNSPNTKLFPTSEPRLFRRQNDNAFVYFVEDESGNITHVSNPLYPKIGTFERVAWYETIGVHLAIVAGCVIFFLLAVVVWLFRPLWRAGRGQSPYSGKLNSARILAATVASLNLIFLVGLPLYIWWWGGWRLVYGVPPVVVAFFVLPIMTTILSLGLFALGLIIWQKSHWSVPERLFYDGVTLAAVWFIPILVYWNLLGFEF